MTGQSKAASAVRALGRSGLSTLRVPEDIEILQGLGFPANVEYGLRSLQALGLIRRVHRGLYEVREPSGRSKAGFEDTLAGRFGGSPHLVTGWWALARANLTNQDIRKVTILSTGHRRPITVSGIAVKSVVAPASELWGGREEASGLIVATPERALCDCVARRSVRIPAPRLAEAIERFMEQPGARKKLVRAIRRYGSPVAARRLGYLTEAVTGERWGEISPLIGTSRRAAPLDLGDEGAPVVSAWGLRTRLSADDLLEHRIVS